MFAALSPIFGQGNLTPPGAPAPTMKTLDQVEARVIVNAANTPGDATNTFIIRQPGSYYLAGNITGASGKHGISVQADDVTLDLNGFVLKAGGGGNFRGIDVPANRSNLAVRNGTIRGWTDGGIRAEAASNAVMERLRISDCTGAIGVIVGNGGMIKDCSSAANGTGIRTPDRCHVINCIATTNTGNGFEATSYVSLIDCTSSRNGGHGFLADSRTAIVRCSATRNDLDGIHVESGCTIADCTVGNNLGSGIRALADTAIRNCTSIANTARGIVVSNGCRVVENTCDGNATGIRVENFGTTDGNSNRIDGNSCSKNQIGVSVFGLLNQIVRNTANANSSAGYDISGPSLNQIGPIIPDGGTITSNSPWANFQK